MPFIAPEVILEAKRMDLLTYLKNYEPHELVRFSGSVYTTRTHDSLKISNGKWMWWSRGIGGKSALDYLIKVRDMTFVEAVETIMGHAAIQTPTYIVQQKHEDRPLLLPEKSASTDKVFEYLLGRGIDSEIIQYCLQNELIMESLPYHNVVFIGYDDKHHAKHAAFRSTDFQKIMGDCTGSKKAYSFRIAEGNGKEVHLFESAIDLLSYATLCKQKGGNWQDMNLVSLSGVYAPKKNLTESKVPVALTVFMTTHPNIQRIVLHLDNDYAGRQAAKALQIRLAEHYEIIDDPPPYGKDFNDFLIYEMNLMSRKRVERSYER